METATERDERGRFSLGNPGGPGRPPRELSITQALRERAAEAVGTGEHSHIEALAKLAWDMVTDTSIRPRERLAAMQFIAERIEGKPVQTIRSVDEDVDAAGLLTIIRSRLGHVLPMEFLNPQMKADATSREPSTPNDKADAR